MKKITSLFLVLIFCLSMSSTALAAPAATALESEDGQNTTYGWPGTGGAPQITKIEYVNDYKVNGNLVIKLKVTGYGDDRRKAFFDGQAVSSTRGEYFINYGTTADGWYYTYDCGPVPEPGNYVFETTFKSINAPYTQLYFRKIISVN